MKAGLKRKTDKLLPFDRFVHRMLLSLALACGVVLAGLAVGMLGYHALARMPWIDALLNASMILTGMGPVTLLSGTAAKLFASAYALFSGVVFLSTIGLVLAPVFHRILHKFHLDDEAENEIAAPGPPRPRP